MKIKVNLILLFVSLILLSWNHMALAQRKKPEPEACKILKVSQCSSMKFCDMCPSVCGFRKCPHPL